MIAIIHAGGEIRRIVIPGPGEAVDPSHAQAGETMVFAERADLDAMPLDALFLKLTGLAAVHPQVPHLPGIRPTLHGSPA